MMPPACAGVALSFIGTSATGHLPIFVPSTSVSQFNAASCGSLSQRSSAGKSSGNRSHGSEAAIAAVIAHARLLDIDDIGLDGFEDVVSQSKPIHHAR